MDQARFQLDVGIKSVDALEDGSLLLRGYASVFTQDRDRETVHPEAVRKALDGYMQNPILLWQHNAERPIGFIRQAFVDAKGLMVDAVVPAPPPGSEPWHVKAFADLKAGLVRCFSIGGLFQKLKSAIVGMDLMEISCVSVPANPSAIFEVVRKAFDVTVPTDNQQITEQHEHTIGDCVSVAEAQRIDHELRRVLGALDADLDTLLARGPA